MTVYNHAHTLTIKFGDQAHGTTGPDDLQVEPLNSSNPTGATLLDGADGDDALGVAGQLQASWDPITIDGGAGTDTCNLDASGLAGAIVLSGLGSFTIGTVNATNIECIHLTTGGGDDSLMGGNLNDTFSAGAGFDTVRGSGGNDTIAAGDNHDEIYGGDGNDHLLGEGGDDSIFGGKGVDNLDGGAGTDTVDFSAVGQVLGIGIGIDLDHGTYRYNTANRGQITGVESVVGTGFNDEIVGSIGADTMHGLGGDDRLIGGDSNPSDVGDTIYGEAGADTIFGQNGDDTIYGGDDDDTIDGGTGFDKMDGGDGQDTLDYSRNAAFSLKVDLDSGKVWQRNGDGTTTLTTETAKNFEIVDGGDVAEEFDGSGNIFLYGNNGDDILRLIKGGGVAYGGNGSDELHGGKDLDGLYGDGGNDKLYGGSGGETLNGGGSEPDATHDADGDDILNGNGGDDTIYGWAGHDTIDGGDGNDVIATAKGLDAHLLDEFRSVGQITTDEAAAYDAANTDSDGDTITGGFGNDGVLGSRGDDTIDTGAENDSAFGGSGNDTIQGGTGNDWLYGGNGNDTLDGSVGKDTVQGEDGDDTLVCGGLTNDDAFYGGDGTDTLDLTKVGFNTVIDLAAGTIAFDSQLGHIGTIETIKCGTGPDKVTGDSHDNTILGNNGNDTLNGGGGNDTLDGGKGTDTVSYAGASLGVTVDISNTGPQDTGGAGTDTLSHFENLIGSSHSDTLTGNSVANVITGSDGDDTISGGDGNDTITGGIGSDLMDGGNGLDIFVFAGVTDSESAEFDIVNHMDFTKDRFDIPGSVGHIDATVHGALSKNKFDTQLSKAVDKTHLDAHDAVLFTANAGGLSGDTFLIVDLNGVKGYQAGEDLVVELLSPSNLASLDTGDFI